MRRSRAGTAAEQFPAASIGTTPTAVGDRDSERPRLPYRSAVVPIRSGSSQGDVWKYGRLPQAAPGYLYAMKGGVRLHYVSEIRAEEVIVCRGRRRERQTFADERALAEVLTSLRDEGLPFLSVEHGWAPAAVFEALRERGLIGGSYASVSWDGPDAPRITTEL